VFSLDERTRAYLYRLLTPIGALLVAYGVIGAEEADLWVALGTVALVGEGSLAVAYTSTKDK